MLSYKIKEKNNSISHLLQVKDIQELNKITHSRYNIALYTREIDKDITLFIESIILKLKEKEIKRVIEATFIEELLKEELKEFDDNSIGYQKFINDIKNLTLEFSKISGSNKVDFLFSIMDKTKCPLFHIDKNYLRLLCTYYGESTLWVSNDNVNYDKLGCGDNSLIIKNLDEIKKTNINDVIILKGSKYPNNMGNAIVHKSPDITNINRILLRIDSLNIYD